MDISHIQRQPALRWEEIVYCPGESHENARDDGWQYNVRPEGKQAWAGDEFSATALVGLVGDSRCIARTDWAREARLIDKKSNVCRIHAHSLGYYLTFQLHVYAHA